ncbi:phosphotransferase family protein [Telmatobacter bradus]|uniref:phosphotransferase family protein n=1 Tax=Telmatobacter bradus TaxID=474953 RepID=UPI003B42C792
MAATATIVETVEYRLVLIQPASGAVLAVDAIDGCRLPRVSIPQWTRPAQQLRKVIRATWGAETLILDIFRMNDGSTSCVAAELLDGRIPLTLRAVELDHILNSELVEAEYSALVSLLYGKGKNPLSRIGWIDEAIAWIEETTGRTISSRNDIEQFNVGGAFALLRFHTEDDHAYWLKATGAPNDHEFAFTVCLSELCPNSLPPLIAKKKDWNAWLTAEAGTPLCDPPSKESLVGAAEGFASLQLRTVGCVDVLLSAGAFDQRPSILRSHIDAITAYLIDAMARQTSTKALPLSRKRLLELAETLRAACRHMETLGIPDALIHNDLNAGNILYDGVRCVFTDWSEAAIGNPFLSCERLCQLNPEHRETVCSVYRRSWSGRLSDASIGEAFALMPLLAIYAYLYGRGDWFAGGAIRPQVESYARSLARHMDHAAKAPALLEVL